MKYVTFPIIAFSIAAFAQTAPKPAAQPPAVTPDTVILKVGGRAVTAAEFDRIVATFPQEIQQSARTDPKSVMKSYFLMQSLGDRAIAEKLDQTSPYKEQLELQRMQFLATTVVNRQSSSISVSGEEQLKRYEQNKANYEKAKIRAILIMYGEKLMKTEVDMANPKDPKGSPIAPVRQEVDAIRIATDLVKQLRAGSDFAEAAKKHSEDKNSAANGGDFGTIRRADRIPEEIKTAVFQLKPGEISDPIKQPMGYYIVKMEERSTQPFEEVKQTVEAEIRKERFDQWMSDMQKKFEVTIEKPELFSQPPQAGH